MYLAPDQWTRAMGTEAKRSGLRQIEIMLALATIT